MKVKIQGKVYNTETGELIKTKIHEATKASQYTAVLYRTPRSGHFFLYGTGGQMTIFAKSSCTEFSAQSSKIIPLTDREAQSWLNTRL